MLTVEQAKAEITKHGSIQGAAKANNVPRTTFRRWLRGIKCPERAQRPTVGKSLSEFRATHDKAFIVPAKIKNALKTLGDGWEYETAFAKMAGLSLADLGVFRDQFSDYIVVVRRDGKRAWAGSPSLAEKMRSMVR